MQMQMQMPKTFRFSCNESFDVHDGVYATSHLAVKTAFKSQLLYKNLNLSQRMQTEKYCKLRTDDIAKPIEVSRYFKVRMRVSIPKHKMRVTKV